MRELQIDAREREGALPAGPGERLIGSGPRMRALTNSIELAAGNDATVLVTGETGTGKNVVARRIHGMSARRSRPFVHVDCASLAPALIESELFGHERGAFTGAATRRQGRFERAGDGTVFLDEIGDLEVRLQGKLLRVLEEREFEVLGGTRTRRMRARVIAATSRVLEDEVSRGRFRSDLFYRLHILRLHVPPLRERSEDIAELAREAARRASERLGRAAPPLRPDFVQELARHEWPGNVRELVNLIEAAIVRSPSGESPGPEIIADLLSQAPRLASTTGLASASAVKRQSSARAIARGGASEGQRVRIAELLIESGGNVARVARKLDIPRSTLRYRIARLGLQGLVPRD